MIALVVAASENNAIGKNNQLLWHLPNDLKYFKNTTWGAVVIMGRKTFESVNKPLPGRTNIVITQQPNWNAEGVITAHSVEEAIEKGYQTGCNALYIIGGGEIYKQSLNKADQILMTRVHTSLEGDTFFPEIDHQLWTNTKSIAFSADEKNAFAHTFEVWEKNKLSNQ
jgi:dihydrofolate reductase